MRSPARLRSVHGCLLVAALALAACAAIRPPTPLASLPAFSGRLLVIEAARRWQVTIDWRAEEENRGWMRLLHAAQGRIVELRWANGQAWMRDSAAPSPDWQPIGAEQIHAHGIGLMPEQLAAFLLGRVPAGFRAVGANHWQDTHGLHVQWRTPGQLLEFSDARRGYRAILIIDTMPEAR